MLKTPYFRNRKMKRCEMCKGKAQMHCVSDQASLCWACDAKVHSANFLAARHSRNLLCCICQGPTPWSAAGSKLRPIPSVCDQCVDDGDEEELRVVPRLPPPKPSPDESCSSGGEPVVLAKRFRTNNASINTRSDVDDIWSSSYVCLASTYYSTANLGDELPNRDQLSRTLADE